MERGRRERRQAREGLAGWQQVERLLRGQSGRMEGSVYAGRHHRRRAWLVRVLPVQLARRVLLVLVRVVLMLDLLLLLHRLS